MGCGVAMTVEWQDLRSKEPVRLGAPPAQGLFDPLREYDACGVGFVADLNAVPSHKIVEHGLNILVNLTHRGAAGADPNAGDGAGMLVQIPHAFLQKTCSSLGIKLPAPGEYAVGQMFMPANAAQRIYCESTVQRAVEAEGMQVLGWRDVPTDNSCLPQMIIAVSYTHLTLPTILLV